MRSDEQGARNRHRLVSGTAEDMHLRDRYTGITRIPLGPGIADLQGAVKSSGKDAGVCASISVTRRGLSGMNARRSAKVVGFRCCGRSLMRMTKIVSRLSIGHPGLQVEAPGRAQALIPACGAYRLDDSSDTIFSPLSGRKCVG